MIELSIDPSIVTEDDDSQYVGEYIDFCLITYSIFHVAKFYVTSLEFCYQNLAFRQSTYGNREKQCS